MITRADIASDVCMIFGVSGNATGCFEYTPEALRAHALELERELGEATVVTYGPSQFMTNTNG